MSVDKQARCEALSDQAWAALRCHHPAILRIAKEGTDGSEHDKLLVRMVFSIVGADLITRKTGTADR